MRVPLTTFFLCALLLPACGTATVKLGGPDAGADDTSITDSGDNGGDNGGNNGGDNGGNGGNGGDSTTDDTGGSNGGNGGNGGDTGTASTDSYTGDVSATLTVVDPNGGHDQTFECNGDTSFSITSSGALSGTASCQVGRETITGPLVGTENSGAITATWSVQLGATAVTIPLKGTVHDTTVSLTGNVEGPEGAASVRITATQS